MQRVTVALDDDLMRELDRRVAVHGYQNRSEAMRDLARAGLRQQAEAGRQNGECLAAPVYTYDHEVRELAKRLTRSFHEHHDLSLAALHVHLDHDTCWRSPCCAARRTACSIWQTMSLPSVASAMDVR